MCRVNEEALRRLAFLYNSFSCYHIHMNFKIIILIVVVLVMLAIVFYFYIPIKDSPMSGGPVSASNTARAPEKVSLYQYNKLVKAISSGNIRE